MQPVARYPSDDGALQRTVCRAVKIVNQTLHELCGEQHPDQTFIGRSAHGFDFLGYHLTPTAITPARQTLQNFAQWIARLYEQGADPVRIGQYVRNWRHSGLSTVRGGAAGALIVALGIGEGEQERARKLAQSNVAVGVWGFLVLASSVF